MFITKAYVRGLMVVAGLLIGATQSTDPRCNRPVTKNHCNASETFIEGWKNTGWFFEPVLRVCLPFFTRDGWHVCTKNYDVPNTREICEELCADPCIKSNGAPGICMHNDICKIVYSQKPPTYKSCSSNNVNCCPKIPDRELIPTGGQVYTNGGIVETAIVRQRDESGYPPDLYSYIFYLPKRPKNDSRHYEY